MSASIKAFLLGAVVISLPAHAHNGVKHAGNEHVGTAHATPKAMPRGLHGGQVHEVKGTHYELVSSPGNLSLYLSRQGRPVDISKMRAMATVIYGNSKEELRLLPNQGNKLAAKHDVKISGNAMILISIASPGQSAVRMRFALN